MGWTRKRNDPISERARSLQAEIDLLETQIKELTAQSARNQPRLRSTALPHNNTPVAAPAPVAREQVFEKVDHHRLQAPPEAEVHLNDLGIRKYNLAAAYRRLQNIFRGSSASNPKLVSYLAAGSIQGLRPLRYEKRVARRRFMVLVIVLFLLLWGIIAMFLRH